MLLYFFAVNQLLVLRARVVDSLLALNKRYPFLHKLNMQLHKSLRHLFLLTLFTAQQNLKNWPHIWWRQLEVLVNSIFVVLNIIIEKLYMLLTNVESEKTQPNMLRQLDLNLEFFLTPWFYAIFIYLKWLRSWKIWILVFTLKSSYFDH